jgi:hypothetical protein
MANYTGTTNIYNTWVEYMCEGANLGSDTFIMGLTTSSYTPSQTTHALIADITNEVSGNGYSRQTLGSVTSNRSGAVLTFDFANPVFTASGGSIVARYWFIFDDTLASDPLVAYGLIDQTPADVTTTDGNTLTIQVNASGLFTVTRS